LCSPRRDLSCCGGEGTTGSCTYPTPRRVPPGGQLPQPGKPLSPPFPCSPAVFTFPGQLSLMPYPTPGCFHFSVAFSQLLADTALPPL
uniref:Uncharacterized protein n=1 Tax=Rhinolophus ferrumequinum TaxID=59479 RepID=A0A671FD43_RHIFE